MSVSGTLTVNAGTNLNTSALALDASLTGGTQKTKLIDTGGTNVASVSSTGALSVASGAPATANILAGSATANAGTIITVPVNKVWAGWVTISCSQITASTTSTPTITIVSAGTSFPATTTILCATTCATGATGTSATPSVAHNSASIFIIVGSPTATNTATLQLNNGAAAAPTSMIATAVGTLF